MSIFILAILTILLGSHFIVYYSLIVFFGITKYKISLLVLFFILSVSFVLASILVHIFNNVFVRTYYYISSLWLGALSYLFIFSLISLLILGIFKIFHISFDLKIVGIIIIFLTLLITGYGLYNANNPVVKNVDIKIKNLPEVWKQKKVVFISDLHLGAIIREGYLEKIVNMINDLNPSIVFITGDLLDGSDGSLDHLADYINTIKSDIYYVNGNHETYLGMTEVDKILQKTKIKELKDEFVDVDGVQIVGVNYKDRYGKLNIDGIFEKLKNTGFTKDKSSILLYHEPVYIQEFSDFGINLQLSGHTHKGQIWPFGYITNLLYKGKDYGLYTKDNYNLYTTNGIGTWGPPMRVGNTPEIVVLNLK
nr:metallophosphoesterase [Candidatus Gracilibacteria bacterium]